MRTLTCFKAALFMLLAALSSASLATTVAGTVVSRSFGDTVSTPIPGATVNRETRPNCSATLMVRHFISCFCGLLASQRHTRRPSKFAVF